MKQKQSPKNQSHSPVTTRPPAPTALSRNESSFNPSPDEVARRAFLVYEIEGSQPGHEMEHWLTAEADLIAEYNRTRTQGFQDRR